MSDLQAFEKVAMYYSSVLMVGVGLLSLSAGIILWLGGSIFHRAIGFVFGIIIGTVAAWIMMPDQLWAWLVLPVAAGALGAALSRTALAMMGVVIFGTAGCLVIVFYRAQPWMLANDPAFTVSAGQARMELEETVTRLGQQGKVVAMKWQEALNGHTATDFAIPAVIVLAYLVASVVFRRAAGALAASSTGTVMIGLGLMCLLLQKGSTPLTMLTNRPQFYGLIVAGMIVFGTLVQYTLCPCKKKRPSPMQMEALKS
jgi:hypothetical protein